jgi:hypothetical protein
VLRFAAERRRAEGLWALVTDDALNLILRFGPDYRLPVVGSVDEALQRFKKWDLGSVLPSDSIRCSQQQSRRLRGTA